MSVLFASIILIMPRKTLVGMLALLLAKTVFPVLVIQIFVPAEDARPSAM